MVRIFSYILLGICITAMANADPREANEAYANGNFEKAEELYTIAIEENPSDARLYFNLGNARAKQGKVEKAIEAFMEYRALAQSPREKAKAEYNIGTMLAENKKWKPAANHFKNALKLYPEDMEAKHNYEQALAKQKEEEEGEQGQDENEENKPPPEPSEYALAMKKQAEKLVAERQYRQAYDLMQQALDADETVQAFNDFIERTKNVANINDN